MKDVEHEACYFYGLRDRKDVYPLFSVRIAPDSNHGCNAPECVKDMRRADISGMQDDVRTGQRFKRLRPDQSVRVGYYSYMIYFFLQGRCLNHSSYTEFA